MSGKAAVYPRVSTAEQARDGHSLDAQESICREFASRQGWPVVGVFVERGVTGGAPLRKRPALLEAVRNLDRGDHLVVVRLDRLYRAREAVRAEIDEAIESRGARVRSTQDEGTLRDTSADVMTRGILNSVGLGEKLRIGERTRETLARRKADGRRMGQLPYGWRLAPDGRSIEPDPARAGAREAARALRASGMSLRAIAAELTARGYRAHRRPGRVLLADVVRLMLGELPGALLARLAVEPAGRSGLARSPLPTLDDLQRALDLSRSREGMTAREVLAILEREAAEAPPAPGEAFPLSTIRLFIKESA